MRESGIYRCLEGQRSGARPDEGSAVGADAESAVRGGGTRVMEAGEVATAGAYVVADGWLPFAIGGVPVAGRLPVIRLGGHREPGESPWACAAREVFEEASLSVRPLVPPATYWAAPPHDPAALVSGSWVGTPDGPSGAEGWGRVPEGIDVAGRRVRVSEGADVAPGRGGTPEDGVAPVLVAWRDEGARRLSSAMFLATGAGTPAPANETAGLLLLTRADVHTLVRTPTPPSLRAFLDAGGRAVLRAGRPLPLDLPLEPFFQLRALVVLLARHPDLLPGLR